MEIPKKYKQLFERCERVWGINLQEYVAVEEMAELTKVIMKTRRNNDDISQEVIEELADVQIMIWQLALFYGPGAVEKQIANKVERLAVRLKEQA